MPPHGNPPRRHPHFFVVLQYYLIRGADPSVLQRREPATLARLSSPHAPASLLLCIILSLSTPPPISNTTLPSTLAISTFVCVSPYSSPLTDTRVPRFFVDSKKVCSYTKSVSYSPRVGARRAQRRHNARNSSYESYQSRQ